MGKQGMHAKFRLRNPTENVLSEEDREGRE
jgi:hypothetical protein